MIPESSPLRRPHYFDGRLLRADTSQVEQAHLRALAMLAGHAGGGGVVSGLDARLASAELLQLGAGLAIDPAGRVLLLSQAVELDLSELIERSRCGDRRKTAAGVTGSAKFEPCATAPVRPPAHLPLPTDLYLITIEWLEEPRGDDEIHAGPCDDPCATGAAWRYLTEGILVRAIPLDVGKLAASTAFPLEPKHLRSRVASAYFAGEARSMKSLFSAPGLGSIPWCRGAMQPVGPGVPLAVVALSGGIPIFLDAWTARRERIDAPPRRYWASRMAMRPWSAFLAQILQFQCQLHDALQRAAGAGGAPHPTRRALLAEAIDQIPNLVDIVSSYAERVAALGAAVGDSWSASLPEWEAQLASFRELESDLRAAVRHLSSGNGDRALLRGGIVELPSAGYLPITPEAATAADRPAIPTVNEQVRRLLGEGVDLRFCVTTPDAVAHALEESQHMDRISLLHGLDHPDQRPEVDILVPDGIVVKNENLDSPSDQGHVIRAALDWVLFRRRRTVQGGCSIARPA